MKTDNTSLEEQVDTLFNKPPIDKEVPDDIWGTIYSTWTGLWTDGYGEWDEKQPSDIYALTELLSSESEARLKTEVLTLIQHSIDTEALEARIDELKPLSTDEVRVYGIKTYQYATDRIKQLEEKE